MKKILLLNGSPRGGESGTLRLARAFAAGLADGEGEGAEYEEVTLAKARVSPCLGCFACWRQTPGTCVLHDDMDEIREKVKAADYIIESYPLYFFGMPSGMKAVTDRMLPLMKPYEGNVSENGASFHELRDAAMEKKRLILVSTCGYAKAEQMYGALIAEYDLICGKGHYTPLLFGEGELLGAESLAPERDRFCGILHRAGAEFAGGGFSKETLEELEKPFIPYRAFEMITRRFFGV